MFKLLKVNIWLPFYIIVLIASLLFANAIYSEHREILNETKSQQRELSKAYHSRLDALFTSYESTQNLIAYEYLNSRTFNIKRIKALLDLDPLLLEIWIFTADGKLQLLLHKLALKETKIAALSSI